MQSSHSFSGGNQASTQPTEGHSMPNQDEQQTNRPMVTDDRESHDLIFEAEMAIVHENSKFLQLQAFKQALLC